MATRKTAISLRFRQAHPLKLPTGWGAYSYGLADALLLGADPVKRHRNLLSIAGTELAIDLEGGSCVQGETGFDQGAIRSRRKLDTPPRTAPTVREVHASNRQTS